MLRAKAKDYVIDHRQNHVITKPELVFVRQLNFSNDILEEIQNYNYSPILQKILGTGFNFYTKFDNGGTKVVGLEDWEVLVRQEKPTYLDKIQSMIVQEWNKIDPTAVIGPTIRANLNIGVPDNRPSDVHHDVTSTWTNEWSALVHLNESDGPTDFVISKIMQDVILSVPFKAGQVIIFPSVYAHRGSVPAASNRLTINYIFNVDTEFNTGVLKR